MDPSSEARNIAKEQYTNVRRSLADFEERVIATRWDEDTLVRRGFDRFLGSLDRVAGWLLAEGDQPQQPQQALEAGEPDTAEQVHQQTEQPQTAGQARAGEPGTAESAPEPEPASGSDTWEQATADEPGMADQAQADIVDVAFTLPADVEATSVVLSGEFNDWSTAGFPLSHDADGTWRVTVPLEPGRSYRYRFLIDGERWENAQDADDYVPNPFGTVDSVVIVGPRPS